MAWVDESDANDAWADAEKHRLEALNETRRMVGENMATAKVLDDLGHAALEQTDLNKPKTTSVSRWPSFIGWLLVACNRR